MVMNLEYEESPLVSIVITTYKGEDKLKRAIVSSLNQTYKNIEIIVVDDNNPNSVERKKTETIMDEFKCNTKIRYIKHDKNKNGAVARNTGIENSNGQYISFLDNDDFYLPNKIEKCVLGLSENDEYDAIYTSTLIRVNEQSKDVIFAKISGNLQKDILLNYMLIGTGSNLFITKKAINKLRGFDAKFLRHQDVEFLVRFFNYYKMINIDEVLIVKDNDESQNKVDYEKLFNVKKLFFYKFKTEINKLTYLEKERYYKSQYFELLIIAFNSGKKEYIKEAKKNYLLYKDFGKKDRIIRILVKTNLYRNKIYNKLILIVKNFTMRNKLENNNFNKEICKYE